MNHSINTRYVDCTLSAGCFLRHGDYTRTLCGVLHTAWRLYQSIEAWSSTGNISSLLFCSLHLRSLHLRFLHLRSLQLCPLHLCSLRPYGVICQPVPSVHLLIKLVVSPTASSIPA